MPGAAVGSSRPDRSRWHRGGSTRGHPSMSVQRQLHLGAFMRPVSIHTGAWRYPGAYPDANFDFRAATSRPVRAAPGGGEVRCLIHGRSSGRAEHADRRAEAQPYGHVVRPVHAAVGARRGHRAHRLSSATASTTFDAPVYHAAPAASPRSTTSAAVFAPAGTSSPPPTPMPRSTSASPSRWTMARATCGRASSTTW